MAEEFKAMQVAQILDKTTVVILGPGIADVNSTDDLEILAVGREVPGVGLPLVIPKATVKVNTVTPAYVIARTGTYETEITTRTGGISADLFAPRTRTITRRYELTVDEKQMTGNPASTPVSVGDPVIKRGHIDEFISYLLAQRTANKA